MKEILTKIEQNEVITLFRHVLPDGDAFGSQFGLAECLKLTYPNKKIYCLGSPDLRFGNLFPTPDIIDDSVIANSLAIVLDTANSARVDDQRYKLAKDIIKIDHHPAVEDFGRINWVDTSFPACAEIIAQFIIDNNLKLNAFSSKYLFIGIMTDTGRLSFGNVSERTYRLLSHLVSFKFNQRNVFELLSTQNVDDAHLRGYMLSNFELRNKVASLIIPNDILTKYNNNENAASLVNLLSGIDDCQAWVMIGEGKNDMRVELRSKNIAVNNIAREFGGGGHHNAAGARVTSFADAKRLIARLEEEVNNYLRFSEILKTALEAALLASKTVMDLQNNDLSIEIKADNSPVTIADLKSNEAIIATIKAAYPEDYILSEENKDDDVRLTKKRLWIIDPIDGTKDYINKTNQFAINIAYSENGKVKVGVVAIPAQNCLYYAISGAGAYKLNFGEPLTESKKITVSNRQSGLLLGLSRFHLSKAEKEHPINSVVASSEQIGSSYKLCLVAEGIIDVVFKLGAGTKEWDVAAPDIIIKEAGGIFVDGKKQEFIYNRIDVANLNGYIALNNKINLDKF